MSTATKDPVSALRSDIAAIRSIIKHFNILMEDYHESHQTWYFLCLASQYAANALNSMQKQLPKEAKQGGKR